MIEVTQEKNRVIILGGGVTGLCSAYYALKQGMEVTVIQREEPDGDNCSMGNAGMIVPSHFTPLAAPGMIAKGLRWMFDIESPFYIRPRLSPSLLRWAWLFYRRSNQQHVLAARDLLLALNLESCRLFGELAREGEFGLVRRGLLMLCKTTKGLDEEASVAGEAREIGLAPEVLDAAGVARLDPMVTMDVIGGVHFPEDCHLDPARFMSLMRTRVSGMGAEIISNVEIDSIERSGDRVTALMGSGRRFAGGRFVIAGGAWSSGLLSQLGLRMPLQAGKGYSLSLSSPSQLPERCSILVESKVAVTPMGPSLRFAGTMEIGGLDLSINPSRVRGIVKSVSGYFPKFSEQDFADVTPWAGLRPVSPDGVPYLGEVPGFPNVVVATGHAMMGLSLGPVTGQLVANLLAGERPFRAIDPMSVTRFG